MPTLGCRRNVLNNIAFSPVVIEELDHHCLPFFPSTAPIFFYGKAEKSRKNNHIFVKVAFSPWSPKVAEKNPIDIKALNNSICTNGFFFNGRRRRPFFCTNIETLNPSLNNFDIIFPCVKFPGVPTVMIIWAWENSMNLKARP